MSWLLLFVWVEFGNLHMRYFVFKNLGDCTESKLGYKRDAIQLNKPVLFLDCIPASKTWGL